MTPDAFYDPMTPDGFRDYCVGRHHAVTVGFWDATRRRLRVIRNLLSDPKVGRKDLLRGDARECLRLLPQQRRRVMTERRLIEALNGS